MIGATYFPEVEFETAEDVYQNQSSQNVFGCVPFRLVITSVCSPSGRVGETKKVML